MIATIPRTPKPIEFKEGSAPANPEPDTVYMPRHHREHRDQTLGIYMDAWSRTETAMSMVLGVMLGPNPEIGRVIFASLSGAAQMREVLMALSRTTLSAADQKSLEGLCDRAKRAATKRNRIVHGRWTLQIDQNQETGIVSSAVWARTYMPADPELFAQTQMPGQKNQSARENYAFTLPLIHRAIQDVEKLMDDFLEFHEAIRPKDAGTP